MIHLAKLWCWFRGHKRGVRVAYSADVPAGSMIHYRCPRCAATWARKMPKAAK